MRLSLGDLYEMRFMPNGYRCIDGRVMRHDPQGDDPELETDIGKCPFCGGKGCRDAETNDELQEVDPRDPDPSRPGVFRDHNCARCHSGKEPCVTGNPNQCEYPHARND